MADIPNSKILKLLEEKIFLKQEVFNKTKFVFTELNSYLSKLASSLKSSVKGISKEAPLSFKVTSEFESQFTMADESLLFVMHTNIFTFDSNHEIWRNKYVLQDPKRAYCGKIFIYNFLTDSFKYNRSEDVGYLIARIFVNREGHFFAEGKKQLGYTYFDFQNNVLDKEMIEKIAESSILYALDFDSFTPPLERIVEISVRDVQESGLQHRIKTGKRLGFEFGSEGKDVF